MTFRCSCDCFCLHFGLLQLYCHCLWLTISITPVFKPTIWTFSLLMHQHCSHAYCHNAWKPEKNISQHFILVYCWNFFFFPFWCGTGGCIPVTSVHCGLKSDPLCIFLQHCSKLVLQSSFVMLKEPRALSHSHLFFLILQEFKRSSVSGFVLIWAVYFWTWEHLPDIHS